MILSSIVRMNWSEWKDLKLMHCCTPVAVSCDVVVNVVWWRFVVASLVVADWRFVVDRWVIVVAVWWAVDEAPEWAILMSAMRKKARRVFLQRDEETESQTRTRIDIHTETKNAFKHISRKTDRNNYDNAHASKKGGKKRQAAIQKQRDEKPNTNRYQLKQAFHDRIAEAPSTPPHENTDQPRMNQRSTDALEKRDDNEGEERKMREKMTMTMERSKQKTE